VFVLQLHQPFWNSWKSALNRVSLTLTEEKLDESGARLEHFARNSLAQLARQAQVSIRTAWRATETLHLQPYIVTNVQVTEEGDYKKRTYFCNWFLRAVYVTVFFTQSLHFSLMKFGSIWVGVSVLKSMLLEQFKYTRHFWSAPSRRGRWNVVCHYCCTNTRSHFFKDSINSERHVSDIPRPFFERITKEEKTCDYFIQDGATTYTATYSINVLNEVFDTDYGLQGLQA
jgi:hypothetical protein